MRELVGGRGVKYLWVDGWRMRVTYIVDDTGVFVFVGSGEGYSLGEGNGSIPDDLDLHAVGVELCTAAGVLLV